MKKLILMFLNIYQRFFTLIGFGSCRYYPTCSEYAKWQFENNSIIKALYFSLLRILRCNQLFPGGIEYPVVSKNMKHYDVCCKKKSKISIKYWLVPKDKQYFFIIKNFKRDDKSAR